MPWGAATYAKNVQNLVATYKHGAVKYQSIPWLNWFQTFTSAVQSRTGPTVSTGGSFQPFQFYQDGAIAPADNVLATLTKTGVASDYLPGTVEALRYQGKLVGIPNTIDTRMLWYRKSLLDAAGVGVPANWDEFRTVAKALKKNGVYAFGIAGNASDTGYQQTFPWILNNGGGLFNANGEPDCVTPRNVEAVEYLLSLVKDGYISPSNISYTIAQVYADVTAGHAAMAWGGAGLDRASFPTLTDFLLADPLTGPHGDKGTLYWVQPVMMYNTKAAVSSTEDFLVWWASAVKPLFANGTFSPLPARKSFRYTAALKSSASTQKAFDVWLPVGKGLGTQSKTSFPLLNSIEGAPPTVTCTQQIIQGQRTATQILQTLQDGYESLAK
jgi:multiple sugar transport system substrate-binding protein